jgi:primosomal protein DnaI
MSDYLTEQIYKTVVNDEEISEFIKKNNLTVKDIDRNLVFLFTYLAKRGKCNDCGKNILTCKQDIYGKKPSLVYSGGLIDLTYSWCPMVENYLEARNKELNLTLLCCSFDHYSFKTPIVSEARKPLLEKIKQICSDLAHKKQTKGVFLYGKFGTGKSYLLAYLSKLLAGKGIKVTFAYFPDLTRMIKSSIGEGTLEKNIEQLKVAPVLILDDFGGCTMTNFIRDEVLGPILQYRMDQNLLTCMTSNLTPDMIEGYLSDTTSDSNPLASSRIFERMASLMEPISLVDKDYRMNENDNSAWIKKVE